MHNHLAHGYFEGRGTAARETFRMQAVEDDSLVEISQLTDQVWLVKLTDPKGTIREIQVSARKTRAAIPAK